MADPDWRGGAYAGTGVRPEKGLAVARMAAHITYLSEAALQRKFGRELQRDGLSWGFDADFQVESYLRHQGASFVDRFDANSYLYITRAMDYFDLAAATAACWPRPSQRARDVRFCVLSFSSDWLYPTAESRDIVRALNAAGAGPASSRSRATRATTPSSSTSRCCTRPCAASSPPPPRRLGRDVSEVADPARTSREILRLVRPGARVLDVGCGEGELLELLTREKGVDGRGLEISPAGVSACLAGAWRWCRATPTATSTTFPAGAFDYAILSQTLQAVARPRHVLAELLRIAERAIVSLPNFGHWRVRLDLLLHGRMPMTGALPEPWWATPNIHLCTLRDFTDLCGELDLASTPAPPSPADAGPPDRPGPAAGELARRDGPVPAEPRLGSGCFLVAKATARTLEQFRSIDACRRGSRGLD